MISWIQKTFQQHFKSVFLVLLAVVIISFVFVTNASSGLGGSDRGHLTERMVFGYNLASNDDQARLFGDAMLSAELQSGYQLGGEELQNYGLQRAAALHVANQLHIPATTKLEVADYIKTLRIFAGQDGQFDASRYTMFRDSLKNNPGINEASVSRVLADDVRINKVQQLLGGPGYVQADDVASMLSRADTRWTIATATLDYGKYSPNIPATDAELTKFFEENTFRYEIAPRVAISVVSFPAAAYVDQVQVSETDVRAFYESNPARFPQPNADKPATDPNAAYAAVRPQVETALRFSRAQQYALKAASDFSYTLFESKVQPDSPQFEALLSAQKLSLVALAPFTHDEGPAELGRAHTVTEEAFKLGPNRRISDAVSTPAGAAILIYRDTLPTHTPTFAEVRAKVQADYVEGEEAQALHRARPHDARRDRKPPQGRRLVREGHCRQRRFREGRDEAGGAVHAPPAASRRRLWSARLAGSPRERPRLRTPDDGCGPGGVCLRRGQTGARSFGHQSAIRLHSRAARFRQRPHRRQRLPFRARRRGAEAHRAQALSAPALPFRSGSSWTRFFFVNRLSPAETAWHVSPRNCPAAS
ncbi:MAG: peptidyl-prolyl cis-trans isomerase [Opitutus sp.]|nr:peptidyl-prolyl cis-trans isomerase [Opitutus sp.]